MNKFSDGMSLAKIVIGIIFLYGLTLFQSGFLPPFSFFLSSLNLILILAIILNLFEKEQKLFSFGIFFAFFGGFFLDVFSSSFFGKNIIILLGLAFFIKFVLKKYVRIPFVKTA